MTGFKEGAVGVDGRNSPLRLMLAEQTCCIKPHRVGIVLVHMSYGGRGKLGESGGDGGRQENLLRVESFYAPEASHSMDQSGIEVPEGKIREIQIHTRLRMMGTEAFGNRFA